MPHNSANDNRSFFAGMQYTAGSVTAQATARAYAATFGAPHPPEVAQLVRAGQWSSPALRDFTKANAFERDLDQQTYGLTLGYAATARWQHNITLGYDRTVNELTRPVARLTTPADTFLYYSHADEDKLSLAYNTALEVALGPTLRSTLQAGYDQWTYTQDATSTANARRLAGDLGTQSAAVTRTEFTNRGFFAQAQTSWRDQLFLTFAGRADDNSAFGDDYGLAIAPRVGLAHVLERGLVTLKTRAAWGEAIRPPRPVQRTGNPSTPTTTYRPNEALGPESQSGFDIGAEIFIADRFSVGATYYNQTAEDLISLVRLNPTTVTPAEVQYQNVGRVKNTGWELEGTARFGSIRIAAQYSPMNSKVEALSPSYTGAEFAVGVRPPIAPAATGRISVGYTGDRASATLGMTHTGSRRVYEFLRLYGALYGTDPNRPQFTGNPADYRVDAAAFQRYEVGLSYDVTRQLNAFLNVDNLLDNQDKELSDIDPVRGRQTVIGLRLRY